MSTPVRSRSGTNTPARAPSSGTPSKNKSFSPSSPIGFLQSNPLFQMLRIQYEKARIELQRDPKLRNDLKIGGIGLLAGVILGGLLAKTSDNIVPLSAINEPGWNPVHVFYGKMNHLIDEIPETWYLRDSPKHQNGLEWFGQHGQDVAVAKFLGMKTKGFFVDLAANDAVWASNTFALEYNFDWRGICIEPNPVYWYRLSFRKNCQIAGTIVGGPIMEEKQVNLPSDDIKAKAPFGGIIGKDFDNKNFKFAQPRYTASLVEILKKFKAPKMIDYLNLDVEGAEEYIMKDFPFHKPYTFKVITIERPNRVLKRKLESNGYKHVLDFKRGDTLWAHKSVFNAGKKRLEEAGMEEAIRTHIMPGWPNVGKKKNMGKNKKDDKKKDEKKNKKLR